MARTQLGSFAEATIPTVEPVEPAPEPAPPPAAKKTPAAKPAEPVPTRPVGEWTSRLRGPQTPLTKRVTLYVDPVQHKAAQAAVKTAGLSYSELVHYLVAAWLSPPS